MNIIRKMQQYIFAICVVEQKTSLSISCLRHAMFASQGFKKSVSVCSRSCMKLYRYCENQNNFNFGMNLLFVKDSFGFECANHFSTLCIADNFLGCFILQQREFKRIQKIRPPSNSVVRV